MIVIPINLWKQLSSDERDTLMTHELSHARRRDHWFRWIEWTIIGLLWWNPIVWWARSGLRKAEEDSCDAWVLWAHPSSAKHYAQALVKTFDFLSGESTPFPIAACGIGERRKLNTIKKRFIMILKTKPSHRMTNMQKQIAILLAALILPLSGYILHARETAEHVDASTEAEYDDDEIRRNAGPESIDARIAKLERMLAELMEEKVKVTGTSNLGDSNTGPIPEGYWLKQNEKGEVTHMEPIPGSPAAQKIKAAEERELRNAVSAYIGGQNVLAEVRKAFNLTSGRSAGWGALLADLPESDARSLRTTIGIVQANLAIDALIKAKEISPGALFGALSDTELQLLKDKLAALDTLTRPEDLKEQLIKVYEAYDSMMDRLIDRRHEQLMEQGMSSKEADDQLFIEFS